MVSSYILFGIVLAAFITFAWRLLGFLSVGKMQANHPLVLWAASVAFATVAALTAKLIIYPLNYQLQQTPVEVRTFAVVVTMVAFFVLKRSFIIATILGMCTLYILTRYNFLSFVG